MAAVSCFLGRYLENITVCLCYSIKYKITEDVLHYGKHRYDKQVTKIGNCAVCGDGNLHRTSQKYYILEI